MEQWLIQTIVGGVFTIVIGFITFALKRMVEQLDGLEAKVAEHDKRFTAIELDLAKNYVKHTDLEALKGELASMSKMLNLLLMRIAVIADRLKVGSSEGGDA